MSQKGKGLLGLIVGAAAGAAAIFLSKEENRAKTVKVVKKARTSAKKVAKTVKRKTATRTTTQK